MFALERERDERGGDRRARRLSRARRVLGRGGASRSVVFFDVVFAPRAIARRRLRTAMDRFRQLVWFENSRIRECERERRPEREGTF